MIPALRALIRASAAESAALASACGCAYIGDVSIVAIPQVSAAIRSAPYPVCNLSEEDIVQTRAGGEVRNGDAARMRRMHAEPYARLSERYSRHGVQSPSTDE